MRITGVALFLIMATMTAFARSGSEPLKVVQAGEQKIRVWDRGTGSPILLVHGMFGDYLDWEPVLEPLAKKHRVIAIDLPGFGGSSKPRVAYTSDFFTDSLDVLLRQIKVKKATIAANSFGGIVAMLYALKHPERVERLVLIDTGGLHHFTAEEETTTLTRFSEANLKLLTPQLQETMFGPLFANGPSSERSRYIDKQNAKLSRADFPDYAYAIHHSIKLALETDLRSRLSEIKVPTLLLQGEKDYVVQTDWVREASTKFPNAELKVFPCGHIPQLECSELVVDEIERFVSGP